MHKGPGIVKKATRLANSLGGRATAQLIADGIRQDAVALLAAKPKVPLLPVWKSPTVSRVATVKEATDLFEQDVSWVRDQEYVKQDQVTGYEKKDIPDIEYSAYNTGWDSGDEEDDEPRKPVTKAEKKKVLLIGNGNMGGSVLEGIHMDPSLEITVVNRSLPKSDRILPEVRYCLPEDPYLVGKKFDLIALGIKPDMVQTVLPLYQDSLKKGGLVFSLLAGTSCETIGKYFPKGTAIVRGMPNLAATVSEAMTGLYANQFATIDHHDFISNIAESFGKGLWVQQEERIDAITAVSGSGTGYMAEIMRVMINAAVNRLGFSEEEARLLVAQTMYGAGKLALEDPRSLESIRNAVTSPKGTTYEGLKHLMAEDVIDGKPQEMLASMMEDVFVAAFLRAGELRRISAGLPLLEDKKPPVRNADKVAYYHEIQARKAEEKESATVNPYTGHGFLEDGPGHSPSSSSGSGVGNGNNGHNSGGIGC